MFSAQSLIAPLPTLVQGFKFTLILGLYGVVLATVAGAILGILRAQRIPVISQIIDAYSRTLRGLPFLTLLFIIFFVLPSLGVSLNSFSAAVLSLTLHSSAYILEIVRAGIEAVPRGQWEAATALGLSYIQRLRYVAGPQAMRVILPPLVGQYVLLVKDTSLASLIGIIDVVQRGIALMQVNRQPFLVFLWVAVLYFVVCYPLILVSERLERVMAKGRAT